jgi:hypothetical protein
MGFAGCRLRAAPSFKNIKEKTPYAPEDDHVGQNM